MAAAVFDDGCVVCGHKPGEALIGGCLHAIHKGCAEQRLAGTGTETVRCSKCSNECRMDELQPNPFLPPKICQYPPCGGATPAQMRCAQCEADTGLTTFLWCDDHFTDVHQNMFTGHTPVKLEGQIFLTDNAKCEGHPDQKVKHYCSDCDIFACSDCTLLKHSTHKHMPRQQRLAQQQADLRLKIEEQLEILNPERIKKLLETSKQTLIRDREQCEQKIKETFDDLQKEIATAHTTALERYGTVTNETQKERMQKNNAIEELVERTKQLTETLDAREKCDRSPTEMFSQADKMAACRKDIQTMVAQAAQLCTPIDAGTLPTPPFANTERFKQLIETFGKIKVENVDHAEDLELVRNEAASLSSEQKKSGASSSRTEIEQSCSVSSSSRKRSVEGAESGEETDAKRTTTEVDGGEGEIDEDLCAVCHEEVETGATCDDCDRNYHLTCHVPQLCTSLETETWKCSLCGSFDPRYLTDSQKVRLRGDSKMVEYVDRVLLRVLTSAVLFGAFGDQLRQTLMPLLLQGRLDYGNRLYNELFRLTCTLERQENVRNELERIFPTITSGKK